MKIPFTILLICLAIIVVPLNCLQAQSTVIELNANRNRVSDSKVKIPDSLNGLQRSWELLLSNPYPGRMPNNLSCRELLIRLRRIGLPVVLDDSARDDSLIENDQLAFEQVNGSLYEILRPVFKEHNATLIIQANRIAIVSLDVSSDPEFFITVTYNLRSLNVVSMNNGRNALLNSVKASIDPDGWDDTNGDGVILFSGPELMTLSTSYETHLQIRRFLYGHLKLQGPSSKYAGGPFLESRIVRMPGLSRAERRRRSGRGTGGGGFGGGGGVF